MFARRQHAPLSARLLQEAQRTDFFTAATGFSAGLRNHAWLGGRIYIPERELDELREAVAAAIPAGDWSFVEEFTGRCSITLAQLEVVAGEVAADQSLGRDPAALDEALAAWCDSYRMAMAFVPAFRLIDEVLSTYLEQDERAELMRADPGSPTEEARERAALRALARQLASSGDREATGGEVTAAIAAHVERYGWLGTRWHLGTPFSSEDVRRRAVALAASTASEALSEFELRSDPAPEADPRRRVIRKLAYLRSHRAEAVNRAIWTAAPLFDSIGRCLGVPAVDVPFFLPGELYDALHGVTLDRSLPEKRQTAFATVLVESEFFSAEGEEGIEQARRRLGLPDVIGSAAEGVLDGRGRTLLRGVVASPGRATGRVCVVRDGGDDRKVESGDILVTTMTYPSLVGSMQRSAAVVTDDGGLLSHAAVTARELEKPCLIDTGRATEVLSDGDWVEVDCEAGVVNRAGGAGRQTDGSRL